MNCDNISPKFGVVVIGRNEGERLRHSLASVLNKAEKVIYVDSGSTDGSAELARQLGATVVELDAMQPFSAARARNEGFAALKLINSDVRFVQFIDGDCELNPNWLNGALAFISQRNDIAVVCGRLQEHHPEHSIYNRLCDFEWNTPVGEAVNCGGNALIRVEAFEQVGGFQPNLIAGEEPELCLRLRENGWKIWRLGAEMAVHDASMMHFDQWWTRAVRAGYAIADVKRLHIRSSWDTTSKAIVSSIFWGGVLPLAIGIASLFYPIAIFAVLMYPLQVSRIALRRGPADLYSWIYAFFIVLSMFAQLIGVLTWSWRQLRGGRLELIEYKRPV